MSINELQTKVKELKNLQRLQEELKNEITAIQDQIKTLMLSRNESEIIAGEYKIRLTPVVSSRFDTTAFKNQYADLYRQFTRESHTQRFSIA